MGHWGIAVLGAIGTAIYCGQLTEGVPPGLPDESADAARETLGGAVSAAEHAPGPIGDQLLDTARNAFTDGLHLIAGISIAVLVVTAALFTILLRRVPAAVEEAPAPVK